MRNAALLTIGALLMLFLGCGRTGSARRDGGAQNSGSSESWAFYDGGGGTPSQVPDLALGGDAWQSRLDSLAGDAMPTDDLPAADVVLDTAASTDLSTVSCAPLSNDGVLNLGHIKKALFASDGRLLLVRIGRADDDAKDDARLIELPSGASRVLQSGVRDIEWLGKDKALIASDNGLTAVSLDGSALPISSTRTCSHVATPDGKRVYFTHSQCTYNAGPLGVIDLTTGTPKQLAASVSPGSLAVSPDSRWAAYIDVSASSGSGVINVADAAGSTYALTGYPRASRPVFASGQNMLFRSTGISSAEQNLWRYDLESRETQSLTTGDPGLVDYALTADGSAILAAKFPGSGLAGELYLVPLEGQIEVRLATDLIDYRMFSMLMRAFAFAPIDQRAIYITSHTNDAGRTSGISSMAIDGNEPIELSPAGQAMISPYANRVAIITTDHATEHSTLSVLSTAGAKQFTVEGEGGKIFAGFVPGDRGLLFVQTSEDKVLGSTSQLRHLSFKSGNVTTLTRWTRTTLMPSNYPVGIVTSDYPIDPSGCYTVVDSDMDQSASRLVALPD